METHAAGKKIACEQTPRYLFYVNEILAALPDAQIINITRDVRDVALSQKNKWKTYFLGSWNMPVREAVRVWANYHPYTIAKLWVGAVRMAQSQAKEDRLCAIRFEGLVEHPEATVQSLCDFVNIRFEADMLNTQK